MLSNYSKENMSQATIQDTVEVKNKRPVFLSILCILSFIGSGIWALISLITLLMPEKIIRMAYSVLKERQGPKTEELLDPGQAEMVKQMEEAFLANMIEYSRMYLIAGAAISLVLALTAIFGVARMWHLRKSGFWIYIMVNVISIGGMIYLENWIGIPFVVLFIILYSLNLKHLK
jgi:hypothetical protein